MEQQLRVMMDAAAWQHHLACQDGDYKKEKLIEELYNLLKEAHACTKLLDPANGP